MSGQVASLEEERTVETSPEVRLALAEANIKMLTEAIHETNAAVRDVAKTVADFVKEMAEFLATLRHPRKDHCVMVDDMEDLEKRHEKDSEDHKKREDELNKEIITLKTRADKFDGGIRVVIALIGGGSLLTIIAILSALAYIGHLLAGKLPASP